jgi:pimeloyl-ACP methyl ester carboxylesterase
LHWRLECVCSLLLTRVHAFVLVSGWSDAPDVVYDEHLYVGQLAELLFALRITAPIALIGVSMGGAIVSSFTARYPAAVAQLCMVCPAGLPITAPGGNASHARMVTMPVIGPNLFKRAVKTMQAAGAAAQWEHKDSAEYVAWGQFAKQNVASHDGFVRTLYRTVIQYPMSNMHHNYAILAQQSRLPILIVWGEKDGLTPYANGAILQALLPGSQLVTVIGAKHNFIIERPQPVNEILAAWMKDANAPLPTRIRNTINERPEDEQPGAN